MIGFQTDETVPPVKTKKETGNQDAHGYNMVNPKGKDLEPGDQYQQLGTSASEIEKLQKKIQAAEEKIRSITEDLSHTTSYKTGVRDGDENAIGHLETYLPHEVYSDRYTEQMERLEAAKRLKERHKLDGMIGGLKSGPYLEMLRAKQKEQENEDFVQWLFNSIDVNDQYAVDRLREQFPEKFQVISDKIKRRANLHRKMVDIILGDSNNEFDDRLLYKINQHDIYYDWNALEDILKGPQKYEGDTQQEKGELNYVRRARGMGWNEETQDNEGSYISGATRLRHRYMASGGIFKTRGIDVMHPLSKEGINTKEGLSVEQKAFGDQFVSAVRFALANIGSDVTRL